MKKYRRIIALCVCLSCFGLAMIDGTYSFADSNLQLSATKAMPDPAIVHYEANSINDFLIWLRNPGDNKEVFKEFIAYWTGAKNYLVPDFCGGKLNKVFADSNQNLINFLFDNPSVRVAYECLDNTNGFADIFSYMESKYNVEYDKMIDLDIYSSPLDYNNGYEYNKHIYTKEKIVMKNYSAECVCETSYSEKSNTCYNIAFLYNDMLVRFICYTESGKTLDKNVFENLSLICVNGSPLDIDPPITDSTVSPTTEPPAETTEDSAKTPKVVTTTVPATLTAEPALTVNKLNAIEHKVFAKKKSIVVKVKKKVKLKYRITKGYVGKIKFSSSNKKVATVNSSGVVKGRKKGSCNVTIKLINGQKAVVKIKVK